MAYSQYNKQTWADLPSTSTPLSAARLQYIEDAVAAASTQVIALSGQVASLAAGPGGTAGTGDATAPTINSFTATPSGSGSVVLAWTASDNVAVTRCTVSRSGTTRYDGNARTFTETGLINGTSYNWTLTVYDAAGNVRTATATATPGASTTDTTKPTVSSFNAIPGDKQVALSWAVSDNVAVTRNLLTRGGVTKYDGTSTSFTDTGLTNGTGYNYTLAAYDAAGNSQSVSVSATPVAAPTTAKITIGTPTISGTSVTITWSTTLGTDGITPDSVSSSRDGVDSSGFGAFTATGDPINGSRTFNNLVAGSTYHFTVQLIEAGANYGTAVTATVTVPAATSTPAATVLATESFAGASGAAWPSQWTTLTGSGGVVSQDGSGRGRLVSSATPYTGGNYALLSGAAAKIDLDVTLDVTFPVIAEEYLDIELRASAPASATSLPSNSYFLEIYPGSGTNSMGVSLRSNGNETSLSGDIAAGAWIANTARRIRFQAVGSTIAVKVWAPGTTEPTAWMWAGTDSTLASTTGRLLLAVGSGAAATARTVFISNVSVSTGTSAASVLSGGSGGTGGSTATPVPNGPTGTWNLVFRDEFDGTSLDTSRWSKMDGGSMNKVTTRASNISVTNSCVVLQLSDANNGAEISSGPGDGAGSNGYLLQVGDYVEASVYFPGGPNGLYNWPAFWTSGNPWPAAGEHDIAEVLGGQLTVNYHSPSGSHNQGAVAGSWANAFHTYGLYRKASSADVYWDGKLVKTYSTDDNGGGQSILANIGVSADGQADGTGSAYAIKVDYVRVWRPGASTGSGTGTTAPSVSITGVATTASSATVSWVSVPGNNGVTLTDVTAGRDGTDSTGYGAYTSGTDPLTGSRTFGNLVPGTTYTFAVQPRLSGAAYGSAKTISATIPAATGGSTGGSTGGTGTVTSFSGPRSKLPWNSGAFVAFDSSVITPYEQGRGRKLDNISTFTTRDTADTNTDTSYLSHASAVTGNGGWLTVGVPLWANNQSASSDITAMFQGIGQNLNASGFASRIIVRLGWEMNLSSWPHNLNGSNQTQWIAQFKKAVGLLRQYAPGIKVAFNPNEGGMQTSGSVDLGSVATQLLSYYEFVGPDCYNWYPIVNDASGWSAHYNASFGLKYWEDFARSNNKGYIVPEWGGYPGSSAGQGSDGSYYAQQMIARFAALASSGMQVVESHFNEPASYIADSLWDPQQMPAMATAVKNALAAQPTLS